jgi:hypothetical protein
MWTASELQTRAKALKLNQYQQGVDRMENWGNHAVILERLEGATPAEAHETMADLFVVTSGETALTVGGVIADPVNTSAGEIRGKSINGGVAKRLAAAPVERRSGQAVHLSGIQGPNGVGAYTPPPEGLPLPTLAKPATPCASSGRPRAPSRRASGTAGTRRRTVAAAPPRCCEIPGVRDAHSAHANVEARAKATMPPSAANLCLWDTQNSDSGETGFLSAGPRTVARRALMNFGEDIGYRICGS